MLTIAVLSVLIFRGFCVCAKNDCIFPEKAGNQADYYWRDYFGVVPKDAVPGGYDETGNVTYIGQIPSKAYFGIFPGNIYPGRKEAEACIVKHVLDDTYVKILCSNPRNKFEWIQTTSSDSHVLTDYHLVVGGAGVSSTFNIGRANFEGKVQIGRVFNSQSTSKGLWLCDKTGNQLNFQSFEVLVLAR